MPGGRWKPLQHWFAEYLFRDVVSVCGVDGRCYIKNDDSVTLGGYPSATSTRRLISAASGAVLGSWTTSVALPLGGGAIYWFCLNSSEVPPACPLLSDVREGERGMGMGRPSCIAFTGCSRLPRYSPPLGVRRMAQTVFLTSP